MILILRSLMFLATLVAQLALAADYSNSIGIDFVKIEAGCFNMGRDSNFEDGADNELPLHQVCITEPFYLGKTELTQAQWVSVMGSNPSKFKGRNNPVEQVSWQDVQIFIRRLNEKESVTSYRLPTEAEWEYAARAGSKSAYHFGDDEGLLPQYAWFLDNAEDRTHPVAQKEPNQWGLYDMQGNVWEWVQDWYDENYYQKSPTNDPKGPTLGKYRMGRGGSKGSGAWALRSAHRTFLNDPDDRLHYLGFRLLRQP